MRDCCAAIAGGKAGSLKKRAGRQEEPDGNIEGGKKKK